MKTQTNNKSSNVLLFCLKIIKLFAVAVITTKPIIWNIKETIAKIPTKFASLFKTEFLKEKALPLITKTIPTKLKTATKTHPIKVIMLKNIVASVNHIGPAAS